MGLITFGIVANSQVHSAPVSEVPYDEVPGWFEPERYLRPVADDNQQILILSNFLEPLVLDPEAPSGEGWAGAQDFALLYLRNTTFAYSENISEIERRESTLFKALIILYPDHSIVRLALASYHFRYERYWDGVFELKTLSMRKPTSTELRQLITKLIFSWEQVAQSNDRESGTAATPTIAELPFDSLSAFQNHVGACEEISDFVAITYFRGMPDCIRADRVEDFVSEHWPVYGLKLLSVFQQSLRSILRNPEIEYIHRFEELNFSLVANSSTVTICSACPMRDWREIYDCLWWINDILGVPDSEQLLRKSTHPDRSTLGREEVSNMYSGAERSKIVELLGLLTRPEKDLDGETPHEALERTICYRVSRSGRDIEISRLEDIYQVEFSCWRQLFERGYVGFYYGGPRLSSSYVSGRGLRISFDLLVTIAGIERAVVRDRGIVLIGFCTALVPMKVINEWERSVQWHLVVKPKGQGFRSIDDRADFWETLVPAERLRDISIENLNGVAYVGWLEAVNVSLGTDCNPREPDYSNLKPIERKWKVAAKGMEFGVQVGFPGGALIAQATREKKPVSAIVRYAAASNFELRINELFRATVFIYDEERKTAWLCPTIHLLVLMLRLYLTTNGYQPLDPDALRFVERKSGIEDRFVSRSDLRSLGSTVIQTGSELMYGQVLAELASKYGQAFGSIETGIQEGSGDNLIGFEFKSILYAREGQSVPAKELPMNHKIGVWRSLVNHADVVFGRGFQEILRPVEVLEGSPICRNVPLWGEDVLVCPVYLLQEKLKEQSYSIYRHFATAAGTTQWVFSGNPFKKCSEACDGRTCWRGRLQQIKRTRLPALIANVNKVIKFVGLADRPVPAASESLPFDMHGAICFGEAQKKLVCTKSNF
jgi:hypothetical protein